MKVNYHGYSPEWVVDITDKVRGVVTTTVKFDNNPLEIAGQLNNMIYEQMRYRSLYNQLLYKKGKFGLNMHFYEYSTRFNFYEYPDKVNFDDVQLVSDGFSMDEYLENSQFLRFKQKEQ